MNTTWFAINACVIGLLSANTAALESAQESAQHAEPSPTFPAAAPRFGSALVPSSAESGVADPMGQPVRFFDDFRYASTEAMKETGFFIDYAYVFWNHQQDCEGEGAHCARFVSDGATDYMVLQATRRARTSGHDAVTSRVQSTFHVGPEGTFAARVKFNADGILNPATGLAVHGLSDVNDQDFYAIRRDYGMASYSEVDFEYLSPKGWYSAGADFHASGLWLNSWKMKWCERKNPLSQQCPRPLQRQGSSLDYQWSTLVFQVLPPDQEDHRPVRYFVESPGFSKGELYPDFDPGYGPDSAMRLEFSNWFGNGPNLHDFDRTYTMHVDWVFFSDDTRLLKSDQVAHDVRTAVKELRGDGSTPSRFQLNIVCEPPEAWRSEPTGTCPDP